MRQRDVGIADVKAADFETVFATNVSGAMLGMKYAAPAMAKQGGGSIITIASASGLRAGIAGHIYSASKAAVIQLSRCVASELGSRGVRLNTISPGGIVTGIFAKSAGLDGSLADRVQTAFHTAGNALGSWPARAMADLADTPEGTAPIRPQDLSQMVIKTTGLR